ncbi:MAG: LptF/LptG family permease, partial [Pseudomonadota bacterium]|nr:LptF/LptG family permease [Pseudomonadota bacterium]
LMFMAVVMLAACISLRPQRRGGTALMIAVGILIAFCLFFMRNLIYALGLSGAIPVTLAAWSPAFIVLLAAVTMLLHMEDG